MKKKQMCVDFNAYLSGVTHMRQELTVWQIKSHFSIVCRFYLFSLFFFKIFDWNLPVGRVKVKIVGFWLE